MVPRHHLVPQMHLRRFATAKERIKMVRRDDLGRAHLSSVDSACAEVGFYALDPAAAREVDPDGHGSEVIEQVLGGIETAAAQTIRELLGGSFFPPHGEHRRILSLFIALGMTRGWRFRSQQDTLETMIARDFVDGQIHDDYIRFILRGTGRGASGEEVEQYKRRLREAGGDGRLAADKSSAIIDSIRIARDELSPRLSERTWRLLHFDEPCLLTSDNPVGLWSPDGQGSSEAVRDAAAVFFPLDRKTCLSLTQSGAEAVVRSGATRARQINAAVAREAVRWILHHPDDDPLNGLQVPDPPTLTHRVVGSRVAEDGTVRVLHHISKRPSPG